MSSHREHGHPTTFRNLAIRSLEVTPPGGAPARSVFCPRRQISTALERCLACQHFVGFLDPSLPQEWLALAREQRDGGASAIACDIESADDDAAASGVVPVARIMTKHVYCVREHAAALEVHQMLAEHRIHGAPVIDDVGRPIGVITKRDLERASRDPSVLAGRDAAAVPVGEIMTPFAYSVGERASVTDAANLMIDKGVHRVPVVSADGVVVGIVSAADALAYLAHAQRSGSASSAVEDDPPPAPSLRRIMLELLWVCGDCGAHYPHARECPVACHDCGAPRQHFYAPIED